MDRVRVTSAELQKYFGRCREIALREPLVVTNHGRDSLVLLAADEYRRLKRRDRQVLYAWEMDETTVEAIERAEAPDEAAEYDHETNS